MAKHAITIVESHGGQAASAKQGIQHSFAYARHIDFRKDPMGLSILPKTTKETSTTVTGLITEMIQLPSGKMVAIDSSGGVYTRTTGASWSKNGTTLADTACGMVYNLQHDTIYIPGLNNMHSITNADGRFTGGSFTVNDSTFTRTKDQEATSSANTYATTGSISEAAADKLSVTPTVEPLYSIKIWVTTKGTGTVAVTMHDAANNELGSASLAAANITDGALNEFVFSTPVRTSVSPNASTYHFHITHAGGTSSTIGCGTASDFSTARYETHVNFFVNPVNDMHPAIQFLQYLCFLNERYLAVWEPISQSSLSLTEFQRHRLVFPTGYEGTSAAPWNEYLAMALEKRSTSATNEFQDGQIIFWDGVSQNFNFKIEIPEGSPYGLFSHKNTLFWFAGGGWWAWNGGEPVKLFQMPYTDFEFTDTNTYMLNLPHTMAVRNGILMGAFPSETNSTAIEHGIYSFGARDKNYAQSFGYSYTMSTGTRTNGTLRLGMVKSFGDKLFLSWRDGANYGVDVVDPNSDPFAAATYESLIIDNGRPDKQKQATHYQIDFEALPTGATVTPKYKIDRGAWVTGTAATAGATEAKLNINKRYKEIQVGFDLVATTATPKIIGQTLMVDLLGQEGD